MTNKIGPNDLGKHPDVIKKAQQELLKMDILVCGGCHATFHFVLGFEEHKENCKGAPNQKQKNELAQNWAFLLWKSAQANAASLSSWKLYQNWALLDNKQQAAWVTAGQTIQTISRIGHGAVQEAQVKVMRTVTGPVKSEPTELTPKAEPESSDVNSPKIKAEKNAYQKVDNSTNPPTLINRFMVKRTMNSSATHIEVRECLAEKVTSRRHNAKRNVPEYLVKWSDYESTWEPRTHFDKAQELILECERKLKQKLPAPASPLPAPAGAGTPGRPERTSKARAVTTLKSWLNTSEQAAAQGTATAAAGELKRKNTDSDYAEAEDSSQDESFGTAGSPSPAKQMKTSTQIVQKTVGGQVRYYQKAVNGSPIPTPNSAEVVIDKLNEKTSGVRRKAGAAGITPVKREAQVKVVGKSETTSSGIVRVGKAASNLPPLSPLSPGAAGNSPRLQKVLQTTRTPTGGTVKRTVYRTVATATPGAVSPVVAKAAGVATRSIASPLTNRPPTHTYQVNKQGVTRTPQPAAAPKVYQVSPNANKLVRTPVAKPLRAPQQTPSPASGRVVRSSPGAATVSPKVVAKASPGRVQVTAPAATDSGAGGDGDEMTLCPVTGKLITKAEADAQAAAGDDADSELQRLLTSAEEEAAAALASSGAVGNTQIHELIQNEDGSPVMITGDDGTVYQVAGKNAEGQTLLITQGEEGEQQCVIMAAPEETVGDSTHNVEVAAAGAEGEEGSQTMMAVDGDSQDGQITAELVQADEPSADGTRRVVLLLPDGNLMVSELNEEQYQQFNLGA